MPQANNRTPFGNEESSLPEEMLKFCYLRVFIAMVFWGSQGEAVGRSTMVPLSAL
jgi:hypothetical protein